MLQLNFSNLYSKLAILLLLMGSVINLPSTTFAENKPQALSYTQIDKFKKTMNQNIENIINLVSLDKLKPLPEFTPEIKSYREIQSKIHKETTAFLGLWVNDWELFPPFYSLAIFPTTTKGKVCIIQYQDNQYRDYGPFPGETIPPNPPQQFLTGRIVKGQIVTGGFSLDRSLIKKIKYPQNQEVEFLALVDRTQNMRLYAVKSPPKLDKNLPKKLLQDFRNNGCLDLQS